MAKEHITVTIDKELLTWLDHGVSEHIFASRSHGFEYLIAERIRDEQKGRFVENDW